MGIYIRAIDFWKLPCECSRIGLLGSMALEAAGDRWGVQMGHSQQMDSVRISDLTKFHGQAKGDR